MTSGQAGGGRPTDLPWFKFYVSWAKTILDDNDPNLCTLSDSELGRLLKEILRFVLSGDTEQVSGNERWLYGEIVRSIRNDWERNAMASAKRSAGQTARWQSDPDQEGSQVSQTSQTAQSGQIGQVRQNGQISQKSQIGQICQTCQTSEIGQKAQTGQSEQTGETGQTLDKIRYIDRDIDKDIDIDIERDIERDGERGESESVSQKKEKEKKEKTSKSLREMFLAKVRASAKSPEEIEAMKDYWNSRIKLKHPISTEGTIDRELATLNSLSQDPVERVCIIHQSIDKGWRGLFPLKDSEMIAKVRATVDQKAGPAPNWEDAPEWMRKYQRQTGGAET